MLSIIGCGNTNRQDDGAGVYVARSLMDVLRERPRDSVRVFDAGTSGMEVMFLARGSDALIIIDANQSGSEPGAIFTVPGEELENMSESSFNLHDFRWDNALYAGRKIYGDEFPAEVTVFLIEAQDLDFGLELSAPVRTAADRVIELVVDKVDSYIDTLIETEADTNKEAQ